MSVRYAKSEAQLARALGTIPLGAQTFSKSITQFPHGISPYFAQRAVGAHLWDVDGNRYVDLSNALCAVTLGYCDPDVDRGVAEQMARGTIFTLSTTLESDVAERICDLVPCAEKVRFGKNGSDATAGAIRIARAHTGRDHVLVCGYHGWQDWYIGATARNRGVPKAVRSLTHTFAYNDLGSLDRLLDEYSGQVAAIILEPMAAIEPSSGFLVGVQERARKAGAVLVFDEVITGFRFAKGGAQEFFGVTPDLATLGKGLANGYPLSAVCGRADLMAEMEEIFFSFTMGGEALSLAAAKAALDKVKEFPVIETMAERGRSLKQGLADRIDHHRAASFLTVSGHPAWSFLTISDAGGYTSWEIKTLFLQEMLARGVLTMGSHNMSYAHSEADIEYVLNAYDEVLPILTEAIEKQALRQWLKCPPLEPLFRVR
jgi:glutamate-1-semialdehyde 2,1-aminomutase